MPDVVFGSHEVGASTTDRATLHYTIDEEDTLSPSTLAPAGSTATR